MKNEFYITSYRFHVIDDNKFLIQGWFQENEFGENKLVVTMDDEELTYTTEKYTDVIEARQCTSGKTEIKNRIYLWIQLPKDWKERKKLVMVNKYKGQEKEIFKLTQEQLKKVRSRVEHCIDGGMVVEDTFRVSGWFASSENVEIYFYDKNGTPLECTMKYKHRNDVLRHYPECTDKEVRGFTAEYHGTVPKTIKICLQTKHCKSNDSLILKPSKVKKQVQKLKKNAWKAYVYYQQFGINRTAYRFYEKLTNKDGVSYKAWMRSHMPTAKMLEEQRKQKFTYEPKISIVVPLYRTPEKYLNEMIASIKNQTYANWELCLSDGSGKDSTLTALLKRYEKEDSRIRVVYNDSQLQISENTNEALKIATGDYIAFGDHDDLLAPDAFFECVKAINQDSTIDMIYTDEDKITMDGKEHFQPHFKSDFNIDMLRSVNYICHLTVVKRELFEKVGFLNSEFNGAQDYDFVLRCVEQASNIKHIAKILYHWRAHMDSTAENPESKLYAFQAGARAIEAHYERCGIDAKVSQEELNGLYRSKYQIKEQPLVSIIIPNKDHIEDLDKCIRSIEEKSTYKNVEYIVIENNSEKKETFEYYDKIQVEFPKVKVVFWEREFNYSAINNFGVTFAQGEYLLFLNNDTEIINVDCIEELLGYCMREDVGIVGAKLFYEDDTVQHAGVIIGMGGVAGHAFIGAGKSDPEYFGRALIAQDYSAVTAACLMTKRKIFDEVEGFEEKLAVAFNDVDFCLKVRAAGYLVVYNPYAQLHHYESKSRGLEDTEEKVRRFQGEIRTFQYRWADILNEGDPYYNINLTLDKSDFSLKV
ncbi:MAG: glycosyltransferase family 2 protein [Candidatus Ruminococcus intestinipullorum]|nr:glycosyltransferase family 2 protein [Candidatus Ruminococcus intestinipullorum]